MKIRKSNWYENGEKSSNVFLDLENKSSHSKPNTFTKNRWKRDIRSKQNTAKFNSNEAIGHYLKDNEITKNEVENALGNMICNKTPGNDGLISEF